MKNCKLLAIITLLFLASGCAKKSPPELSFSSTKIDLGDVPAGKFKKGSMKIINTGSEELVIKTANSGCKCTGLTITKLRLSAGAESVIYFTYNAGQSDKGKNFKIPIVIKSNSRKILDEFFITGKII